MSGTVTPEEETGLQGFKEEQFVYVYSINLL
jgi:hypothetical protein